MPTAMALATAALTNHPALLHLGGMFQRASTVTGFASLTTLSARGLQRALSCLLGPISQREEARTRLIATHSCRLTLRRKLLVDLNTRLGSGGLALGTLALRRHRGVVIGPRAPSADEVACQDHRAARRAAEVAGDRPLPGTTGPG
jgi:hypothetical protein